MYIHSCCRGVLRIAVNYPLLQHRMNCKIRINLKSQSLTVYLAFGVIASIEAIILVGLVN
jgi:hypothetical protein